VLPGSIGDELVACVETAASDDEEDEEGAGAVAPIDCVVSGVALVAEPMLGDGMEEEVDCAT
jgi:hypothetical protein